MDQYTLEDSADLIRLRSAWERVLERLRTEVPSAWMERFFRPLEPVRIEGDRVTLAAPGRFVLEWIESRYKGSITSYLGDELGQSIELELIAEPVERNASAPAPVAVPRPQPERAAFRPNERYTFENYVVGLSNRLAVAGARAVAAAPGDKYNPLFIYGASGLGKTHLLHAVAGELLRANPSFALVYVSAQQFAEEFVQALQNNRIEQFRRSQRSVEVWLVDDVQFIAGKERTQEEIFHTFNYLHGLGKQIVVTSDRPPRELNLMEERLRSRFEAGLVADVQMPDTETRCAILLSKAAQESMDLPHEVAMFLAESVPSNIRVLEGALTRLAACASVESRPLSLELAHDIVERYYRAANFAKPGVDQIVDSVGRHFNISVDEIKGTSRKAPIVHARHIAVFITREITGDSWKHIGSLFGDRDHTSMMHGYQKISEMMNQDKDLRSTVRMLIRNLYPNAS